MNHSCMYRDTNTFQIQGKVREIDLQIIVNHSRSEIERTKKNVQKLHNSFFRRRNSVSSKRRCEPLCQESIEEKLYEAVVVSL